MYRYLPLVASTVALFGCADGDPGTDTAGAAAEACEILQPAQPLGEGLEESSGAAASRTHASVVWTHNDSGWPADLYAVSPSGEVLGRTRVVGAENVDWEDLAIGPCDGGECLYIADIGDNAARRDHVAVYRLPEPRPGDAEAAGAERFPMRYPDGPRDAESLFVLPGGEMFVITKGGANRAALYRYPLPLRAGETVELQHVVDVSAGPLELLHQLTAADASPDGRWVAVRSYSQVTLHRADALLSGDTTPVLRFDLDDANEVQGEGLALLDDGTIHLTGEAGFDDSPGTIARLRCSLP